MSDEAITAQPISRRKELETFVRDLDPLQVVGECTLHCMHAGAGCHSHLLPHATPLELAVTSYLMPQNGAYKTLWTST